MGPVVSAGLASMGYLTARAANRGEVRRRSPGELPCPLLQLLPFRPDSMSSAQLAAVSFLARYVGQTHTM